MKAAQGKRELGWKEKANEELVRLASKKKTFKIGGFKFFTAKFQVANLLDKTTPESERNLLLFNWKDRSALSTRRPRHSTKNVEGILGA